MMCLRLLLLKRVEGQQRPRGGGTCCNSDALRVQIYMPSSVDGRFMIAISRYGRKKEKKSDSAEV